MEFKPLSIEDLSNLITPGSMSLSHDGKFLAYVQTSVSLQQNDYTDLIVIVDLNGEKAVASLSGSSPLWSPVRNEIVYMAEHQGQNFLFRYSLESREAQPLAPVYESHYFMGHLSVKNIVWSPDGAQIAFAGTADLLQPANSDQIVVDRLLYKTKGGRGRPAISDDALTHIWLLDVQTRESRLLTDGDFNEHSICWSPDGQHIAFVSNRSGDPDNNQLHDLWSIDIRRGELIRYTEQFGTVYQPSWSPDGGAIAFLATRDLISTNDSPAEDTHVYVIDVASRNTVCVTRSLDRRVEQFRWHPQGDSLFFTAGDRGTTALYNVDRRNLIVGKIVGEQEMITEFVTDRAGKMIYYVSTNTIRPSEIYSFQRSSSIERPLTSLNSISDRLSVAETFWFSSFDALPVQGWLMKPIRFEASAQYPLVLVIHGGPHNMFGYAFEERMQMLAAAGYGVLFINPRGSHGYGQDFSRGCVMNWGGGDYQDLMQGVDAAMKRHAWIDPQHLYVTGQSYGGYMTNWIITQTNRFRAAVSDGGISNLISFAGTSLYHSLIEAEFGGSAYENFDLLWKCSPLRNITNVRTPTLFLHGQTDNEVPLSQAEEMYIGLKKRRVATQLVQYTGEGHGWRPDLKPLSRYDVIQRIIGWFDQFAGKGTASTANEL